jgi:hypothetical protein
MSRLRKHYKREEVMEEIKEMEDKKNSVFGHNNIANTTGANNSKGNQGNNY